MTDEMTLVLTQPIKLESITYTELNLTEPTVKQLRTAAKAGGGLEWGATLISVNAVVPMVVVDKMLQRDFERAADFFAHFGIASPTTSGD